MRNAKVEAMIEVFKLHGFDIPTKVVEEALMVAHDLPTVRYEVGDFVCVYDGMGEISHGTVVRVGARSYHVEIYQYGTAAKSYSRAVDPGDMRGLSSPVEAMKYFRVRSKS